MSLALGVDITINDGTARLTAAVGLLVSGALALAAIEQFRAEAAGGGGGLFFVLPVACAVWCSLLCRRSMSSRELLLRIGADGALGLVPRRGGEPVAAAAVLAWQLCGLVCLRLRPAAGADSRAIGSGDCLILLLRGSFDEARWHGLRRWLVWYRRSRRREPVVA